MENVVPGALQRLRAADIIRMAGLTAASLGQEYCRIGAVRNTQRQGTRLSGTVDVLHSSNTTTPDEEPVERHYPVEVEIQSSTSWTSSCPCNTNITNTTHTARPANSASLSILCPHAAALLYQWLAHPTSFAIASSSALPADRLRHMHSEVAQARNAHDGATRGEPAKTAVAKPERSLGNSPLIAQQGPTPLGSLIDILSQLGLSELRGIAREYEIVTNGMNKQQLVDAILEVLKQPEAVRRVAATLEKPQRQLLAALALAGGSMTDDDLRGMFERFSMGQPNQLQGILVALQGKAMLFRTNLNSSSQQRIGLSGALLDIGWHIPLEVRTALHVSVPVTPFNKEQSSEKGIVPTLHHVETYRLLADLLLVARALDGYRLGQEDEWQERNMATRPHDTPSFPRSSPLSTDGVVAVPPPAHIPSAALLARLQAAVVRPPTFLRFAVRLLRLADLVHKDDSGLPYLRLLPNVAQLLLGPSRLAVIRDLFELWLTQSSYEELFDLQEEGLRLRCRATSLNMPVLRSGELDAENSEARQSLVALLSQVPHDQWVSFPAFSRFVYRLNPLFLQKRQRLFSSPHWWLELENKPLRPLQLTDWSRAELHYLSRLISGPLHWWGACDIALSDDGRLLAFRLTPLAGWLFNGLEPGLELGLEPSEKTVERDDHRLADALEVIDTKEILVRCSQDAWPVIELLETFMETAGVREDRLRYCLSPKALSEALSRGHHPIYLLELLRHVAMHHSEEDGPPAQMLAQIERWIASYGRVRVYSGVTLLETADSIVMRELSATIALNEEIVQAIHPTLLILKNSGAERIIDDLKRRGQSPLLHDEDYYGTE